MTAHTSAKDLLPKLQRSALQAFTPVQREMNRFFEELGDGWDAFTDFRAGPRMDVVETKTGVEVSLELPGLSRDDVTITFDDDLLTVSGEKKAAHEAKAGDYRVNERTYGAFSRSVYLPRSLDGAKIKATMSDGVLKITAPRRPEVEVKTIPIQQPA